MAGLCCTNTEPGHAYEVDRWIGSVGGSIHILEITNKSKSLALRRKIMNGKGLHRHEECFTHLASQAGLKLGCISHLLGQVSQCFFSSTTTAALTTNGER